MITFRVTADVQNDHRVVLTLPPEVPIGRVEFVVTVGSPALGTKRPRTSLADLSEQHAEHWGDRMSSQDVEGFTGRRY